MINTVVLAGVVKRIEVNSKPTRKGPAAMIMVQFGHERQRTPDQPVQFLPIALVRIPPYLYEKCQHELKEGVWVDLVAHLQGVYKQSLADGYVNNEVVADRVQVVTEQGQLGEPEEGEQAQVIPGTPAAAQ